MSAGMIQFSCSGCGKRFALPADAAGKKGTCKSCGTSLTVPSPPAPPRKPTSTLPPMRTRRLMADAEQINRAFASHDAIRVVSTTGAPPELYRIEYRLRSMQRDEAQPEPQARDLHEVEVQLTSEYPRQGPRCKMLTPVFHPNVDSAGIICIGDHWAAGERLVDLLVRIAEMLAYQSYNIKSPLNGQAAMWADLNPQELPTDSRDFHVESEASRK